ncbi:hypothetical protein LDENG_00237980, partial [Lucifuga dentata]
MASLSMAPVNIFKHGADEEKAETARLSSFVGAIAIGDLVKSTLGPKGMDKILLGGGKGGSVTVTNDGATILKAIGVDNPAAKVLVDMSKVQDDEVGDGTTSVTVLAAELLREAELLIAKKIHPQTIISGWRKATQAAREALRDAAVDHSNDQARFQQDLLNIARTTLSSKLLTHHKDHFAQLAVNAVMRLKGSGNLEAIHVIKKLGGSLTDSYLDEGFLLDKKIGVNQPKRLENVNILIANTGMDTDKIKVRTHLQYTHSIHPIYTHTHNTHPIYTQYTHTHNIHTGMDTDKIKVRTHLQYTYSIHPIYTHTQYTPNIYTIYTHTIHTIYIQAWIRTRSRYARTCSIHPIYTHTQYIHN